MNSNQFLESTTSGSVATVATPVGKTQTRGKGIYPNEKGGNLLTGKKTNKKYANSNPMKESIEIKEEDVIIVPGQSNRHKPGFIPRKADRTDHEVEMALSDLFQSAKNAKQVYELIKDIPETVGIEGWVQEKIIKANDYLNTVREYLEHKQVGEVNEAGERSALRYEMMLSNGNVKRFSAKDDADAKRIAKSAGAKSLIKLKADGISFKNKIAEQDVAEGEKKQVQDRKTGKMYDPDEEFKKLQNDPEYIAQMKRMGREEGKGWPKRKDEGAVAEGSEQQFMIYFVVPEHDDYPDRKEPTERTIVVANSLKDAVIKFKAETPEAYIKDVVAMKQGVAEAGSFSYGKPPRKGSVADLAAKKRKEQERGQQPIEPKDQQVGVAKVTKGVAEGIVGKVLGGAALIASLWGIGQNQAEQVYSNSPQLQTLIKYHQMATQQGDEAKIQELERRIENHKTRLSVGKGEVMGADDKPIVPSFESSIMKGIQNEHYGWSTKSTGMRDKMKHELGHETNNYAVMINGKTWKVFADKRQADNVARSLVNKGKDAYVSLTGASVSESKIPDKCPDCGGKLVAENELTEENKDACYYKVKSRYKVWPSAYASGSLVQCRKKGASNWGNKSK